MGLFDAVIGLIGGIGDNIASYNTSKELSKDNFEYNAELQQRQFAYDAYQAEAARRFNSAESTKAYNRLLFMRRTAHQDEVADLRKAGLNPILSATGGNGAATPAVPAASGPAGHGSGGSTGPASFRADAASKMLAGVSVASQMMNAVANIAKTDAEINNQQSAATLNEALARAKDTETSFTAIRTRIAAATEKYSIAKSQAEKDKAVAEMQTAVNQAAVVAKRTAFDTSKEGLEAYKRKSMEYNPAFVNINRFSNELEDTMNSVLDRGAGHKHSARSVSIGDPLWTKDLQDEVDRLNRQKKNKR